ncbi:hypothetical protein [Catellatospora tritici]|uniref:hypothetical protein n=1 Tax=Catellatospora tritici TaxID=2851566 RepID=UPI001C2CD898|nr:hypothetical protein [Catellatospora tritici]MBV1853294.1 hypothetical protein [Catellatospora tritici]
MYAWIWRKLPFGLPGKLGGSVLLLGVVGALLWYVIFPWAEPLLPFDDVQVGDPESGYSQVEDPAPGPSAVTPSGTPIGTPDPSATAVLPAG